jgi:serine/threonine protein kinase
LALTPGTRLGVYEISAPIGEGGMGQVYRATDTALGRQVAIKILPDAFAADPERFARFEREAKTLASLNHPHVAAIYAVEKSRGIHALVMELVEGEDLSQRLPRGAIPLDEALPIAKQIADALEAAHERGIVHRDLKPANIKVRDDGTVKVLDFGLAKALDPTSSSTTQLGMILGTAAYMSPEQARGRAVDRRADVWAFGAVLFEMLSGRQAFSGETVSETLAEVMKSEPPWQALPADVPPHLVRLLRQCLVKEPRQRIRDMGDVRAIDSAESKVLAGTDQAINPFFSDDGQWIGFFAQGKLKKISVATGTTQTLCDAPNPRGGSWAGNTIYFAANSNSRISKVSADGGAPTGVTTSIVPKARSAIGGRRCSLVAKRCCSTCGQARVLTRRRSIFSRWTVGRTWELSRLRHQAVTSHRAT